MEDVGNNCFGGVLERESCLEWIQDRFRGEEMNATYTNNSFKGF